jgi:hypothetical protein
VHFEFNKTREQNKRTHAREQRKQAMWWCGVVLGEERSKDKDRKRE